MNGLHVNKQSNQQSNQIFDEVHVEVALLALMASLVSLFRYLMSKNRRCIRYD